MREKIKYHSDATHRLPITKSGTPARLAKRNNGRPVGNANI